MKARLVIYFVVFQLFCNYSYSQGELSTKFIGDRFNVYNGQVNYKVWSIAEFLVANATQFQLSVKEQVSLRSCSDSIFRKHYLFEEESYWTEYSIREILLVDSSNSDLKKEIDEVVGFVSKNLSDLRLNLYKDADFIHQMFSDEVDVNELRTYSRISIKEVWYYDKINNELKSDILGLGLLFKNKSVWLYYPKLKSKFKYGKPNSQLTKLIRGAVVIAASQNVITQANRASDFEILVIENLYHSPIDTGKGLITTSQILSSGEKTSFTYVNNQLEGEYVWHYASQKVRQRGVFKDGLREGLVKSYFESGKLKSINNYKDGFLDGKQKEFDRVGDLSRIYHFDHKIISGAYYFKGKQLLVHGQFEKGLCVSNWRYEFSLPEIWKVMIKRNEKHFNDRYQFESSWKSNVLLADLVKFSAEYKYYSGDNCLNNKCLSVIIK
ncbi:MAG: hypothetical protein ACJAZ2_001655 [Glaciecola sp.]|jgi:hypothetical protein